VILVMFCSVAFFVVGMATYRLVQFCQGLIDGLRGIDHKPRGFEVKQIMGPLPVLKQKDNDHG
jgi:hypothetical protein